MNIIITTKRLQLVVSGLLESYDKLCKSVEQNPCLIDQLQAGKQIRLAQLDVLRSLFCNPLQDPALQMTNSRARNLLRLSVSFSKKRNFNSANHAIPLIYIRAILRIDLLLYRSDPVKYFAHQVDLDVYDYYFTNDRLPLFSAQGGAL